MLRTVALGACGPLLALAVGGCGEAAHQDAGEPQGSFKVRVTRASFPTKQAISRPERLVIDVRNAGSRTLPDVTVAVDSFNYRSDYPNLASRSRPVWFVDQGPGPASKPPLETVRVVPPGGAVTATTDVWSLGALAPGASRSFVWRVTPVKSGRHTLHYRVYAGQQGRAEAVLADGAAPSGAFSVAIAGRPPQRHFDPETGRVVPGPYTPSGS
ncbi:MAG TPA: hypothetical protein VMU32_00555 [Solirubrobacteraceae bacterium]|nr:hypothetical protein [Solirubrobacteraceae bacterium]